MALASGRKIQKSDERRTLVEFRFVYRWPPGQADAKAEGSGVCPCAKLIRGSARVSKSSMNGASTFNVAGMSGHVTLW